MAIYETRLQSRWLVSNAPIPGEADVSFDTNLSVDDDSHEAEEAAWRAEFNPHAVILTESERPTQLFVAIFIGIDRLLRVDFDLTKSPVTFIQQALEGLSQKLARWKLARWKSDQIPTFGRPEGVIVNYSPDYAVSYDLDGNAIQALDRAYRLGEATFSIGKRLVSRGELDAIFGRTARIVHIRQ